MSEPTKAAASEVSLAPNKGGRPPKLVADDATLEILEGLGKIQCTTKEAACVLKVAESTFLRFLSENDEARDAFDMGKGQGLHSLRRTQFKLAETNAAMAIFLGKNYLGQTDKQEFEHSGGIDVSHARQRLRDKVATVVAAGAATGHPQGD
jgi:hypothetical protein